MYLFGSVQEVARTRDVGGRVAPDPEGGLETKTHPHSQGNESAYADMYKCHSCSVVFFSFLIIYVFVLFFYRRVLSLR